MENWSGWPPERATILFLAIAYVVVWVQLTLYHWRGAFHNKFMWGPVLFTPLAIVAAILYGLVRTEWSATLFVWVFAITALEGLAGVVLHLKGVAAQVGGLNLRNFASGPPVLLAFTYAALALFGLLIYYLARSALA